MIHTYLTTSISDEKEKLEIKEKLEKNSKIKKVHFSDDPRHIGITMNSYLSINELNNLTKDNNNFKFIKTIEVIPNFNEEIDTTGVINLNFIKISIIIFIISIIYTLTFHKGIDIFYTLRIYFGLLIFIFGILKLKNYLDFTEAHQRYDLISKHFCIYAYIYPFLEIILGLFLILNFMPIITYITLSVVLFMRVIGILYAIAFGKGVEYAYLEGTFKLRISYGTLFIDSVIILFSIIKISLLLSGVI